MAPLLTSIALHAGLGILLAMVVWGVGLGWRGGTALAYPAGLLTVTAAAFLVLLTPWLWPLAAAALVLLLVRAPPPPWRRLALAAAALLPFPVALGLLLHGPTESLDSHALGELSFYAAKLVSAADSVAPFRDLALEGQGSVYVEAGSSFLGAAIPGVDPFLFQTTTLTAFLLAALALGLALEPTAAPGAWAVVPALLAAVLAPYPSWLAESPPMALALPLAFALSAIASRPLPLPGLALLAAVLALDLALTKGFGLLLLGALVAVAFLRDHARSLRARTLAALAAGLALLAAVAVAAFALTSGWLAEVFDVKFLPADALRGLADQVDGRDTQRLGPALEIAGLLALGAVLVRARATPLLAGYAVMLLGHWIVGGHGFDILVGLSILLAALHLRGRPNALAANRWLALGAALALLGSAWFREATGVRAGLVLVALLAVALVAMLAPRAVVPAAGAAAAAAALALVGHPFVGAAAAAVAAAGAAVRPRAAAVAAAAVAAVVVAAGDPDLTPYPPALMTAHHDVWSRVADVVPRDGLVFTSLTGPSVTIDTGWNYYAPTSGRQLYVAGWSNSPLLVDEEERARRLRLNAEVVSGRRAPGDVPLEREYAAAFAVLRAEETAPPRWRRLHANEAFVLYRLPG